jgi:SMI1 / KNR4 family (SUKH-1)
MSYVESRVLRREHGSWPLRFNFDAFGNPWEAELGQVYTNAGDIERESDLLSKCFSPDIGDVPEMSSDAPGFIPYIFDFSQILTFAIAGDGAPYCFDYRERGDIPSIIWWDDSYWRRVAPDFRTFLSLFDLNHDG